MPLGNLLAADELETLVVNVSIYVRTFEGMGFYPNTSHLLYRTQRVEVHFLIGPRFIECLSKEGVDLILRLLVEELIPNHAATSTAWLGMADGTAVGLRWNVVLDIKYTMQPGALETEAFSWLLNDFDDAHIPNDDPEIQSQGTESPETKAMKAHNIPTRGT